MIGLFKDELMKYGPVTFTEFFLPQDLPHFCTGCYNCFFKGENDCPHASYVQPIAAAIREADGMIFSSPVYALAESASMKALLDHFAYIYMPHRPMEEMFSKTAFILSVTAGAGTGHCIKTISTSLKFWGVKRIYKYGKALAAWKWGEIKASKKETASKALKKQAKKFYSATQKRHQLKSSLFTRIIFFVMKKMHSGSNTESLDATYWHEKGWLTKECTPFKNTHTI
jgi:multimeric flavodoxin WrbA